MNISLLHHLIDNTLTPEERKELMEYIVDTLPAKSFSGCSMKYGSLKKTHRYLANFKTACMPIS